MISRDECNPKTSSALQGGLIRSGINVIKLFVSVFLYSVKQNYERMNVYKIKFRDARENMKIQRN